MTVALEGIENILKAAEAMMKQRPEMNALPQITSIIEECGGLQRIEELQNHQNHSIYERSMKILESYFDVEEDTMEDSNIAPAVMGSGAAEGMMMHDNLPASMHHFQMQGGGAAMPPQAPPQTQYSFGFGGNAAAGAANPNFSFM